MSTHAPGRGQRPVLWASRPAADNARLVAAIEAAGAVALDLPLLEIVPEVLPAVPPMGDDLWIFTSRAATRCVVAAGWLAAFQGRPTGHDPTTRPRLLAVGPGTAAELSVALADPASTAVVTPTQGSGAYALLAHPALHEALGRRVRIFSGHQPLPELADGLRGRGAQVTVTATHRRQPLSLPAATLTAAARRADALLLTSTTALAALGPATSVAHALAVATPALRVALAARDAGFTRVGALDGPLTDAALVACALGLLHN